MPPSFLPSFPPYFSPSFLRSFVASFLPTTVSALLPSTPPLVCIGCLCVLLGHSEVSWFDIDDICMAGDPRTLGTGPLI